MKSVIALSTAIALGVLATASAALASSAGNDIGGFVMPGSTDGVNPAYHPRIFGSATAERAYGFVPTPHLKHARVQHRN